MTEGLTLSTNQPPQPNFERRMLIAAALSAVVIVLYSPVIQRRHPSAQQLASSSSAPALQQEPPIDIFPPKLRQEEEQRIISSKTLSLSIGVSTAAIRTATLPQFHNHDGKEMLFGNGQPLFAIVEEADQPDWTVESHSASTITFTRPLKAGLERLAIQLDNEKPIVTVLGEIINSGQSEPPHQKIAMASWMRSDSLSGRNNILEAVLRTHKNGPFQKEYVTYHEGTKTERIVPRGTSIATLSERHFCQSIKLINDQTATVSVTPAEPHTIAISMTATPVNTQPGVSTYGYILYFGPRDPMRMKEANFLNSFKLGLLGQLGLLLVLMLKGFAAVTRNYGIAVILLAGVCTIALSPFTLVSYRSMRKMQDIQPKIDQLKKKFSDDPQRMNKETMALFKENKVSPLGGCLPMFIQLPVFFALWSAISHVIELRGASFLWIKDLSLPDRLAKLPFGHLDLNILPILIAILMFIQSKISQKNATATTKEMALLSGPLMSVMFGIMFYQVPSSLALYWATNTLVSLGIWKIAMKA